MPMFSRLEINELLALVLRLKTVVFMPGEAIGRRGTKCNEMYFISEGIVEETHYNTKSVL